MRKVSTILTAVLTLAMAAANGWAATTTGASPKQAKPEKLQASDELQSALAPQTFPISVTDTSFLFGPLLNDPTNKITTDDAAGAKTGIMTEHIIGFRYKLSKDVAITPTMDFYFQLTDTDPTTSGAAEQHFRWRDAYVKLSKANLYSNKFNGNRFVLDSDMRLFMPTSYVARHNNTYGALRLSLIPSMQIAHSRFSLSAMNYGKFWFQSRSGDIDTSNALHRAELYTGPQVNYLVSDWANAFVLYEAKMGYDTAGTALSTANPAASLTDLEPGMDFKVHRQVVLSPFLNWYPNQPMGTTTINLQAAITLL